MVLYQVYCESDNNQTISAIYQASNDLKARDKIKLHVRDSVVKHKISWLITIHRSDNLINFDDLNLKSIQSTILKNLLSDPTKWNENWIWIKQTDINDQSIDQDIITILDYLQDDGSPEVIEVIPSCLLFPHEIKEKNKSENYQKFKLEGNIIADKNNEKSIGEPISLDITELKCANWRPGKPCLPMTRVLEKRQSSPND